MGFYFDRAGLLRLREYQQWSWLLHGFSTRAAGDLREEPARRAFAKRLGGPEVTLVTLRQVHSAIVRVANGAPLAGLPGDSLLAAEAGVMLGVKTADCLPVLLADPVHRAVAAVHAGWRGAAKRVVEKSVGEMRRVFGSDPARIQAAIGPGIQACCFEVGPEVMEEFASQFVEAESFCRPDPPNPALIMLPRQVMTGGHALMRRLDSGRGRVDLGEACRRQLRAAGIPENQIYNCGLCTACDRRRFFSYRREKETAGRMLSVIGVRHGG
jgi:YfiH family protein